MVDTTVINVGIDTTICLNDPSIQLQGFTPTGGTWLGTDVNSSGLFTPSSAGSFLLKYTYEEPIKGCKSEDYKMITIHDLPIIEAGGDTTLCSSSDSSKKYRQILHCL